MQKVITEGRAEARVEVEESRGEKSEEDRDGESGTLGQGLARVETGTT